MKTDAQLQPDVWAELKWEPAVNAFRIGAEVKGGSVTLTGTVHSLAGRNAASYAAWALPAFTPLPGAASDSGN